MNGDIIKLLASVKGIDHSETAGIRSVLCDWLVADKALLLQLHQRYVQAFGGLALPCSISFLSGAIERPTLSRRSIGLDGRGRVASGYQALPEPISTILQQSRESASGYQALPMPISTIPQHSSESTSGYQALPKPISTRPQQSRENASGYQALPEPISTIPQHFSKNTSPRRGSVSPNSLRSAHGALASPDAVPTILSHHSGQDASLHKETVATSTQDLGTGDLPLLVHDSDWSCDEPAPLRAIYPDANIELDIAPQAGRETLTFGSPLPLHAGTHSDATEISESVYQLASIASHRTTEQLVPQPTSSPKFTATTFPLTESSLQTTPTKKPLQQLQPGSDPIPAYTGPVTTLEPTVQCPSPESGFQVDYTKGVPFLHSDSDTKTAITIISTVPTSIPIPNTTNMAQPAVSTTSPIPGTIDKPLLYEIDPITTPVGGAESGVNGSKPPTGEQPTTLQTLNKKRTTTTISVSPPKESHKIGKRKRQLSIDEQYDSDEQNAEGKALSLQNRLQNKWRQYQTDRLDIQGDIVGLLCSLSDKDITTRDGSNHRVSHKLGIEGADQVMTTASLIGSSKAFLELHQHLRDLQSTASSPTHSQNTSGHKLIDQLSEDYFNDDGELTALGKIVYFGRSIRLDLSQQRTLKARTRLSTVHLYDIYVESQKEYSNQMQKLRPSTPKQKGRWPAAAVRSELLKLVWPDMSPAAAKSSFDDIVKMGQRLSPLVQKFGEGVLCLIPKELSNNRMKAMSASAMEYVVTALEVLRPALREWSSLIEQHLMHSICNHHVPKKGIPLLEMRTEQLQDTLQALRPAIPELLAPAEPRFQLADASTPASQPTRLEIGDHNHEGDQSDLNSPNPAVKCAQDIEMREL